jgi:hypothetical protein
MLAPVVARLTCLVDRFDTDKRSFARVGLSRRPRPTARSRPYSPRRRSRSLIVAG